jgi:hypothetical protein
MVPDPASRRAIMTAVLIFADTGTQYPLTVEGVENLLRDSHVTRKRTNGAQSQFWLDGEYPSSIVANVHSEAHGLLTDAYLIERRKQGRGR